MMSFFIKGIKNKPFKLKLITQVMISLGQLILLSFIVKVYFWDRVNASTCSFGKNLRVVYLSHLILYKWRLINLLAYNHIKQTSRMVNLEPKKIGAIMHLKMICVMFIFMINFASCNYKISPIVFAITSQGGDPPGNDHQISFDLSYVGKNFLKILKFPANGFWVPSQCPNGGNQYYAYCDFKSGQATPIPNAGQIQIPHNESFNTLHWNIVEKDYFESDDFYTASISSSEWKLSPNQCTPYEIRMAVNIQSQVKTKQCFSVNLGIGAGASISASILSGILEVANANVKAEMSTGWQRCSEWITPPNNYVLYSSVTNTAPYPNVSYSIPACSSSRIAEVDGYSNKLYTYNAGLSYMRPSWIKWDQRSYIAEPLAINIGNYTYNLSVFGACGAKNLTTHINVLPEAKYPAHTYTVDACAATYLPVIDNYGNIAIPTSPAATVDWIISNNESHISTPKVAQIGNHNVVLNLKSSCGPRNVSATIKVNPEKAYPNISVHVYACSTVRLKVKNVVGVPVPPSSENLPLKSWVSKDFQDYIARPLAEDKGIHNMTLSMFSYCGARNVTAIVNVTQSQDFLVDKKVIYVKNIDQTSYHTLNIQPQDKEVVCNNLTYFTHGVDFSWISMNDQGKISLTPTGLSPGLYSFTGLCSDKCGKFKLFAMDINISANAGKLLSSVGLAMAAVFVAMLF